MLIYKKGVYKFQIFIFTARLTRQYTCERKRKKMDFGEDLFSVFDSGSTGEVKKGDEENSGKAKPDKTK